MFEVSSILDVEQARHGSDLVPKEEQPRYLVDSLPVYTLRAAHFIVHHRFCAPTIHRSCLGPSFGREKVRVAKC